MSAADGKRRRDLAAARLQSLWYSDGALKWLLWPLSLAFAAAAALRRAAYANGLLRRTQLPVPVVVVGNISVGGTGKTPFVIYLAGRLKAAGRSPGIVTRGYRGRALSWPQRVTADSDPALVGDEAVLLAMRTGCPVVAGPDRVAAAAQLLAGGGVDVVLSDDGLQHYALARAFEIAVVDGARGLGNGMRLPAGPLREPAERLASVDAVVVNDGFAAARAGVPAGVPADALHMSLAVRRVYRLADGEAAPLDAFVRRRVHAVAGIAHPERFFRMLEQAGLDVVPHPLPDHAAPDDYRLCWEPAAPVLVTEKDAVKCRARAPADLWCVAVDAALDDEAADALLAAVDSRLAAASPEPPGSRTGGVAAGNRSAREELRA